jgi:hypothetical protein
LNHIETEWTLSIDADYVFPEGSQALLEDAIKRDANAFQAGFDYCVYGEPVHGSILPPRTVLYKTQAASYENDGHGHRVKTQGVVQTLPFKIQHDDRKSLSRWLGSQITYAKLESQKISGHSASKLGGNDRVRKLIVLAPIMVFLLVYVIRGGFLSGWRGLFYATQRFVAEILLSLFLIDNNLNEFVRNKGD